MCVTCQVDYVLYHDCRAAFKLAYLLCFTATPVGTITPEIQGTMDLPPETTHTENTPTPVPEMIMAQCQEDTGMRKRLS